jgi:hypothetical protein
MSHLDEELLAAAALGELREQTQRDHIAECVFCSHQVRELKDLASRMSHLDRPKPLLVPSARVWDAIVAELDADEASTVVDLKPRASDGPSATEGPDATVVPLRGRSVTTWLVAAAAVVGLAVGGVGVGLWSTRGADATVVASASLTDLATEAAAGTATVEDRADGSRVLVLDTEFVPVEGADLEVWLIDPNIEGMVSLGYLTTDQAEFVIPEGYDPIAFPIVDVSVEPRDGVPAHSGSSVTRGVLEL